MKLDLDYIKKLLNVMHDSEDDQVELDYLFENFKNESNELSELDEKKMRHHLFLLFEAGYIQSSDLKLGFTTCLSGEILHNSGTKYWFTLKGYQLLEALNNDTLYNKVVTSIKNIGIETLKAIPSLALEFLVDKYCGK